MGDHLVGGYNHIINQEPIALSIKSLPHYQSRAYHIINQEPTAVFMCSGLEGLLAGTTWSF